MGIHAGQEDHPTFRVFFIPFFAMGHIVPMVDLARQFAVRGVDSTMVVTPANADFIRRAIDRDAQAGLPLRLLTYPFPAADVGLPEGQENLSTVPPPDEHKIYIAVPVVQAAHDRILRRHRPDAVISDILFSWTTAITAELGIPRVTYHAVGAFPQCVMNSLAKSRAHDEFIPDDSRPFVVPDLPHPIEMVRSELPEFLQRTDLLTESFDKLKKGQHEGFGAVVNTFYELEPAYADLYRATDCRRGWFVGPLSLCHRGKDETTVKAERGGDESSASNKDRCMAWLKTQAPASVAFVCFGSWCHFNGKQLREIAMGLEASGVPFLWVVREEDWASADWVPAGVEERLSGRALVVRGWAPQAAILCHPAVGAFMTHCGWNSVTEAVAAGVPMITWPLVFEQFINERLVVGLLRVGMRLYGGFRSTLREEAAKVVVGREVIAQVVGRFAPGVDEEVEGMRSRAKELAAAARAAVEEGGTSYRDLDNLIEALKRYPLEEGGDVSLHVSSIRG